jgi:hypothetical protein
LISAPDSNISRLRSRLRNFASRPLSDKLLVAQTALLLGATRLAIRTLRFDRLERILGVRLAESIPEIEHHELVQARRVAWAVRTVSPGTPWTSNCFPQALTAKILLQRRDVDSTLYIGAAFAEDKSSLKAHAWLRCGRFYLTGGNSHDEFGAVVSYS